MHAGADVHDLDSMRGVGALDMDMLAALRCTQHRRVTGGTHGRERRPAWVRKDLTGINGRARIKASKPPTRAQVLLKQHFAQGLVEATTAVFSRCACAGGTWLHCSLPHLRLQWLHQREHDCPSAELHAA